MDPNLVILAAGIGSRMKKSASVQGALDAKLKDEAATIPKSMIGVGESGRPLLDYLLHNARESGYRDVVLVVGEHDEDFRAHYGKSDRGNAFHGLTISYAVQRIPAGRTKPLGTADALLQALRTRDDWSGRQFTVCNSDNLYSRRALRLLLEDRNISALIDYDRSALGFDHHRIEQFAVIRKDRRGFLKDIIEKPAPEEISRLTDPDGRVGVSMNIFRFTYDHVLPYLERVPLHPARLEKDLPQAILLMLADDPDAMMTIPLAEAVPDLTCQSDIHIVQEYLRREFPSFSMS
ncbi:MAG TPA: sugar phosphate nucleotidyltransferase [Bacteroidota bacterium]|nr:sugar phosphate nucleotidyltransferase [Bacteroidota bacterium]